MKLCVLITINNKPYSCRLLEDSNTESSSVANSILHSGIRYRGSLTHPPCTENVIWTVFTNPIRLAANQVGFILNTTRSPIQVHRLCFRNVFSDQCFTRTHLHGGGPKRSAPHGYRDYQANHFRRKQILPSFQFR